MEQDGGRRTLARFSALSCTLSLGIGVGGSIGAALLTGSTEGFSCTSTSTCS